MALTSEQTVGNRRSPVGPGNGPEWGGPDEGVWLIEPRGQSLKARILELWRYRGLIRYFAGESIRGQYKRTFLGRSWLFLRQLLPLAITAFFFHSLIGIQTGTTPYFIFLLISTSVWEMFEFSTIMSMRSLYAGRRLMSKLYFPRIILPLSTTASAWMRFSIYMLMLVPFILYYWFTSGTFYLSLGLNTLLCIPGILLAQLCGLGLGLPLAVIGGEKRDLRFGVRTVMRFWALLTPVVYPLSLMPHNSRWIAILNPMTPAVELFRQGLLGTTPDLRILVPAMFTTTIVLGIGLTVSLWIFLHAEAAAVDRI